jgi:hypothetical protein
MRTASIALCMLVGGCAEAQQQSEEAAQKAKMEAALKPYIGKTIADYVLDRGSNYSVIDIGKGKRGFQWVLTRQTPSVTVPVGGMAVTTPPQTQTCTVTMIASTTKATPALGDWVIENWRWNGAC